MGSPKCLQVIDEALAVRLSHREMQVHVSCFIRKARPALVQVLGKGGLRALWILVKWDQALRKLRVAETVVVQHEAGQFAVSSILQQDTNIQSHLAQPRV